MPHSPRLQFQQTGDAGGLIRDNDVVIAEIRDLQLCNVQFHPEKERLIGEQVPVPLYWRQYQNLQNPDHQTGSASRIIPEEQSNDQLSFICDSSNPAGTAMSRYHLMVTFSPALQSYVFRIEARLRIPAGESWPVTCNPAHGDLEFCNLWPVDCFATTQEIAKRYRGCYVDNGTRVLRLPHHHIESPDKHNVLLGPGDRFMYLLEDQNPVVEILSPSPVSAGLCAYMWDVHFGVRVCDDSSDRLLRGPEEFTAGFQLYALDREHGAKIAARAQDRMPVDANQNPIYVSGINTFSQTLIDFPEQQHELWAWECETEARDREDVRFTRDCETGYDDRYSLRIDQHAPANSRWQFTALGPSYGQPPFENQKRYRLTGYVRCENLQGAAKIAIRLHRTGQGSVFDLRNYEVFASDQSVRGTCGWQKLQVATPVISPAPDRLHLLLQQSGGGTTWFDNILLETLP